ncbi:MAG: hypothetical protein COT91_00660 [Candidatus Doudnabacteria bacterium CG10_big_fil_rev_8_21_14_0_10_41_10]|uniref:Uncharacterized protein n=1 Tax=Candidatus Doudnabacteria bacterium CG10_big_fil_rev_8_21_14_0_10_41_10 TaxID=1974551 RepID=A0A2H0VER8_9BACT|nr:MAG: hypothetical protein COT91_00660 [Candidatus Doudnabacteria bacterium CG10_big_fil_rev_8_21_14_0_10_41_10]
MKKILLTILIFFPLTAHVVGIQVSPSKIDLEGEVGKPSSAEITVSNPTADIQLFEVYPDDLENIFSVEPKSFTLEAGIKKTVKITATSQTPGIMKTNLSIVGKPLADSRFNANTGVKLPVSMLFLPAQKSTLPVQFIVYAVLTIATLELILYLLRKRKNRKKLI